jgi:hypothetical protein
MVLRKVEVLGDVQGTVSESKVRAEWEEIPFVELKKGHIYRMFDPDGTPVDDGEVSVATSDAQPTDDGVQENYSVQSIPLLGF